MTPTLIIDHNRKALLRLLEMWFASVGRRTDGVVGVVKRHVFWTVLRLLRPAESALRRLIFVESLGIIAPPHVNRGGPAGPIPRSGNSERIPAFRLFDPRKDFGPYAGRRKYAKHGPRIFFFDGFDPEIEPEVEDPVLSPDDLVDAARFLGRMEALKCALEDIPKQAKRLARVMARRKEAGKGLIGPMRPGQPPGHVGDGRFAVDEVLRDCQTLALRARERLDSS